MNRIRKGDQVILNVGKDKGKTGEVLRVSERGIYVQGLNLIKRHTKPNPQANQPGGIVEREAPVHQSNVVLLNSATGKGERVSYKTLEGGRKVRVFRKSGEVLDV
jgi:large subunit ribosomal protein L24